MKATWKKSYGPARYDAPITPVQLPPPTEFLQLTEYLRQIRLQQPRATLEEARAQTERMKKARFDSVL